MKTKTVSKKTKTNKPKVKSDYVVTFGYNGSQEILKGNNFVKLFTDWSPRVFKTIITLEAQHGDIVLKRRLPIIQAKRISGNYKFAEIYANQLLKFFR
jgi:hypothetical protein